MLCFKEVGMYEILETFLIKTDVIKMFWRFSFLKNMVMKTASFLSDTVN